MRWNYPEYGDERVRRKFCWFPFRFNRVAYWLEWVVVREVRDPNCVSDWKTLEVIEQENVEESM